MQIPEVDIDYDAVKKAEIGELVYSKTGFFKKTKWVIKDRKGKYYIFTDFNIGLLAELFLKTIKEHDEVGI